MEGAIITSIVISSTVLVGVLSKVLHTMRHNIKNCWGIQFRSSRSASPINNSTLGASGNINMQEINEDANKCNRNYTVDAFGINSEFIFPSNNNIPEIPVAPSVVIRTLKC